MNWQPAATAPRDGTLVLLHVGERNVEVGYWAGKNGGPAQDLADDTYPWLVIDPKTGGLNAWMDAKVLQWSPLPEPPAVGVQEVKS